LLCQRQLARERGLDVFDFGHIVELIQKIWARNAKNLLLNLLK
jgi:hypothetical protein